MIEPAIKFSNKINKREIGIDTYTNPFVKFVIERESQSLCLKGLIEIKII